MTKLISVRIAFLLLLLSAQANAQPVILQPIPNGIGVNIHFVKGREKELDMIAEAGFKVIRMDFIWSDIEKVKGQYDFAAYDELTANLEKRGIRPYYILDYSNSLYENEIETKDNQGNIKKSPISPQRAQSVVAFSNWAAASAKHFKGHNIIWEIWNEPNIFFWQPKPDSDQYIKLVKETMSAIRKVDPDSTIVAPAMAGFNWDFIGKVLADPYIISAIDGISVHPYSQPSPEYVRENYDHLKDMIKKASPKKAMPIISGEWGYTTADKAITPDEQAKFFAREMLVNAEYNIPISIWYDWQNGNTNPADREENFGLVDFNSIPRPSYTAVQTFTKLLDGYHFVRSLDKQPGVYVLLFSNDKGDSKIVAWIHGTPNKISIRTGLNANQTTCYDYLGKSCTFDVKDGVLTLGLGEGPQYITYKSLNN